MKHKPASLPPKNLPHVASFECSCGTVHNSRDGNIPVGWSQRAGSVFCADCTRTGIASRHIPRPANADKRRLRGEVEELLKQGVALMPPGSIKRVQWTDRVNALLAQQAA